MLGELRLVAGNSNSLGSSWSPANGALQLIFSPESGYDTLFGWVGTTYGGDGENTFALPDLRGRLAAGANSSYYIGTPDGQESIILSASQMPPHTHAITPEISVQQPVGVELTNLTANINFGQRHCRPERRSQTFIITNLGTAYLNLNNVAKTGAVASFTMNSIAFASVPPVNNLTFTVTFKPSVPGLLSLTNYIYNDDSDENPFVIRFSGVGITTPPLLTGAKILGNGALQFSFTNTSAPPIPCSPQPTSLCP